MKGRKKSDQERANIAAAGRKRQPRQFSEQARQHMAEARRKTWAARREAGTHLQIAQKGLATRIKNAGYKFSPQHRANISKAQIGRIPWNKGKAGSMTGIPKSEQGRANMAAAGRKRRKPLPTQAELAERKALRSARCSAWQKGRTLPSGHKAKIARGVAQAYASGRRKAGKLTDDEVREIRYLLQESGIPQRDIAAAYGISQGSMSELKAGKSYRHVK